MARSEVVAGWTGRRLTGAFRRSDLRPADRLAARNAAAVEHYRAGRAGNAAPLLEQLLLGCRAVLGEWHPDTLVVGGNLASSTWRRAPTTAWPRWTRRARCAGASSATTIPAR